MKRILAPLFTLLALSGLLVACKSEQPSRPAIANYVTISKLVGSSEFDDLNKGVISRSNPPVELVYMSDGEDVATFSDADLILGAWMRICNTEVIAERTPEPTKGGTVTFAFRWKDGKTYGFEFSSEDYSLIKDGEYHLPKDAGSIRVLEKSLQEQQRRQQRGYEGESVKFNASGHSGSFDWDVDNDGTVESFFADFTDNGDEAQSNYQIYCYTKDYGKVWIDGAYDISELTSVDDEGGRRLVIRFYAGDYYTHDTLEECALKLVDGQLVIEKL